MPTNRSDKPANPLEVMQRAIAVARSLADLVEELCFKDYMELLDLEALKDAKEADYYTGDPDKEGDYDVVPLVVEDIDPVNIVSASFNVVGDGAVGRKFDLCIYTDLGGGVQFEYVEDPTTAFSPVDHLNCFVGGSPNYGSANIPKHLDDFERAIRRVRAAKEAGRLIPQPDDAELSLSE